MERSLRIESYRNIGFKDEKSHRERLVINNSLKKGELGDLVILIGANNSGKSKDVLLKENLNKYYSDLAYKALIDLILNSAVEK